MQKACVGPLFFCGSSTCLELSKFSKCYHKMASWWYFH